MGGRKARRPRVSSADLPPNECPNCGGTLEFEGNLPEGLCATCGIYVELLKEVEPSREPEAPLDPDAFDKAVKRDLEELSRARGLKTSGKKADLTARLKRYVELRDMSTIASSDSESERGIERRVVVLFLLSLGIGRKEAEAMASLFGSLRALQQAAEDDIHLLAGVSPSEALRIREALAATLPVAPPEPSVPLPLPPPPEEPVQQRPPEAVHVEEEIPATTGSTAGAQLILEPPRVVEPEVAPAPPPAHTPAVEPAPRAESFAEPEVSPAPALELHAHPEEAFAVDSETGPETRSETSSDIASEVAPVSRSRLKRDRLLLYAGTLLQAIGGFGLVLGSLLHDVFRVPIFGRNYAVFGSMNAVFAVLGVILLMAGLAAIGLSLRGGVVRPASATEV